MMYVDAIPGDVLVYVGDQCVLGYTHQDVVNMFQGISIGERIVLEVCRGYNLPFDPNDPNTEIVTTVAVTQPMNNTTNTPSINSSSQGDSEHLNISRSNKSLQDLTITDDRRNRSFDDGSDISESSKPEFLTVNIVKGQMGFGFTIADSSHGQKVKQILDRGRCQTLQEGDLLVDINHIRVRDMSHSDVVRVLKDCPTGQAAAIVVQRGGHMTPSRGRRHRNVSREEGELLVTQ